MENRKKSKEVNDEVFYSLFNYTKEMDTRSVAACLDFLKKAVNDDGIKIEQIQGRVVISSLALVKKEHNLPSSVEWLKNSEGRPEQRVEENIVVPFKDFVEMCSSLLTCLFYLLNNPTWKPNYGLKYDLKKLLVPFLENANGNYQLPAIPTEDNVEDMLFENHLDEFIGVDSIVGLVPCGSQYLLAKGINKEFVMEHHRDGLTGFIFTVQKAKRVRYGYGQHDADMRRTQFQRTMLSIKKDYPELMNAEKDLDRFKRQQPKTLETAKQVIGCLYKHEDSLRSFYDSNEEVRQYQSMNFKRKREVLIKQARLLEIAYKPNSVYILPNTSSEYMTTQNWIWNNVLRGFGLRCFLIDSSSIAGHCPKCSGTDISIIDDKSIVKCTQRTCGRFDLDSVMMTNMLHIVCSKLLGYGRPTAIQHDTICQ